MPLAARSSGQEEAPASTIATPLRLMRICVGQDQYISDAWPRTAAATA
jgi:hypothetical protein